MAVNLPTATSPLIAIVDDDTSFREALADLLQFAGFEVVPFASAAAALKSKDLDAFAAFLLDVQMPRMTGLDLLRTLRARGVQTPAIFVTSRTDDATREQAAAAGALALFSKPFESAALIELIRKTLAPA